MPYMTARPPGCFRCLRLELLTLVAVMLAAADQAQANGAFPDEFSIHFPVNAPHRLLMGANFGLLVSEDDGATWRYSCEPWVVSSSDAALTTVNVSFYQVTADGAVLADSVNITRSSDVACTWPISTGSVGGRLVVDMFPDPGDASFVLAIVVTSSGSFIVASHDGGKTFDPPHLYDTADLLTGVEIARSRPGVVYATSISTNGKVATFLASTNSGLTWTPTILAVPAGTQARILAIDPADEKKVYLRLLAGVSDAVSITADGGVSFRTALSISGQFSSFLRATDGSLLAGTLDGKLYVQPPGATGFTTRNAPHLRCLGQRPGTTRIYACGDLFLDDFSLGYSDDGGQTFHKLMKFTDLLGPLTCPSVQTACAAHWDRIRQVLAIAPDAGPPGSPPPAAKASSHCASVGADALALLVLFAFSWRRGKS